MFRQFFKQPETLEQLFFKSTVIVLATLVLLLAIRFIDGDSHRLGTLQIKTSTLQTLGVISK